MARSYKKTDYGALREERIRQAMLTSGLTSLGALGLALSPFTAAVDPMMLFGLGLLPAAALGRSAFEWGKQHALELERGREA